MRKYRNVAREMREMERVAVSNPRVRRVLTAAPLVLVFALLGTQPARSACSFSPSPDPTIDGAPTSLRAAIQAANAAGRDCQINLPIGTYTLTIANTNGQDNTAAEGDLDITSSGHTITLRGASETDTVINANGIDRAFQVLGGANATFRNLTIEGGVAQDNGIAGALPGSTQAEGGGVLVQDGGHVSFHQVAIQSNESLGGAGANGPVICFRGPFLCGTEPTPQVSPGAPGEPAAGGGLFLSSGAIDLTSSQFNQNSASGGAGGVGGIVYFTTGSGAFPVAFGTSGTGGSSSGGALYVQSGEVRLSRSILSNNRAAGGTGGASPGFRAKDYFEQVGQGGSGGNAQGGGLYIAAGDLKLGQSSVDYNTAAGGIGGGFPCGQNGTAACISQPGPIGAGAGGASTGGGLFVTTGMITALNSTVFGNESDGGPGGSIPAGGTLTSFPQVSYQGNGGNSVGGGLYAGGGSLTLTGVTLAHNEALATAVEPAPPGTSSGGGINNAGANITTDTALIGDNLQDFGNLSNGNDVFGAITSSFTLIGQTEGAVITDNGHNILDVDPALDPSGLRHNGGPTETVALLNNSPAIDTGDAAVCAEAPAAGGLGSVDQRGFHRFDSGDTFCDIGAFEVNKAARGTGH